MKWVLDNLWTLIIIAGVIAQLLQSIRAKKEERRGGPPLTGDEEPEAREFEDPELAERTRRIREEIQRKIAERQRGGAPAPDAFPEEAPAWETRVPERAEPPVVREVVAAPADFPGYATRGDSRRSAEILEQQAALAERLEQAQKMKAASQRRAAFEHRTTGVKERARTEARQALNDELRDPAALRRAFILREVLGPPLSLRRSER